MGLISRVSSRTYRLRNYFHSSIKTKTMTKEDNVKVVVRCRPKNKNETQHSVAVEVIEDIGQIQVSDPKSNSSAPKKYTFDHVFGFNSKQVDLYNIVARPIVDSVLEGY